MFNCQNNNIFQNFTKLNNFRFILKFENNKHKLTDLVNPLVNKLNKLCLMDEQA